MTATARARLTLMYVMIDSTAMRLSEHLEELAYAAAYSKPGGLSLDLMDAAGNGISSIRHHVATGCRNLADFFSELAAPLDPSGMDWDEKSVDGTPFQDWK